MNIASAIIGNIGGRGSGGGGGGDGFLSRRYISNNKNKKLKSKSYNYNNVNNRQRRRFWNLRNLVLLICGLGIVVYLIIWMQFFIKTHGENAAIQRKEQIRKERREQSLAKKKQLQEDYHILKKARKAERERRNNTEFANSSDTFTDFMKQPPPVISNLIRDQQQQQRQQQESKGQTLKDSKGLLLRGAEGGGGGGGKMTTNNDLSNRKLMTNSVNNNNNTSFSSELFLNYQLHKDRQYNITYGQFTKCYLGIKTNKWGRKPVERVPLHSDFDGILGSFATSISTNMKILSLGDSVGIQFHQILEEAVATQPHHRHVLQYAWGEHESISVTESIDGGGFLASFRMTGMFLKKNKGKPPPNAPGGGWLPDHISYLLQYKYNNNNGPGEGEGDIDDTTPTTAVDKFDAMIFRIPHGWLKLDEITKETVTESILLANEWFGIKTVVLLTLYFNNNVETEFDLRKLDETNDMIRELVKNWDAEHTNSGIQVLLMDFGSFVDEIIQRNAALAGYDQSNSNYTLARLGCMKKYPPSLAMVCTDVVKPGSCTCKRNMISIDGLHWCMESLGGRVIATIACLLQCPLKKYEGGGGKEKSIKDCERTCNERYMSMEAIEIE